MVVGGSDGKVWKWVLGVLGVLLVLAAGYLLFQKEPTRVVDTVAVAMGSVDSSLQLTGKVVNDRTVTLTALLDGEIMAIRAREGDVVKAGTVLAELDSRQAQAQLDQANAELELRQQTVASATRDYERVSRLSRAGNASEQALDDSLDAKQGAEASLKAARATLTLNQLRLNNALIRSPFAGTVIQQSAETGQWLEAGQPLFKVVATEGMVIEAMVNASDWPRLSLGQGVELSSEQDLTVRWSSEVSWIAPTTMADDSQGNAVAIRIPPGESAPPLLLGQEVDVDLSLEQVNDVLVVPLRVLQEDSAGQFRAFIVEDNRTRERPATLGLTSLADAQILTGLAEGDQVIVLGGLPLHDGQQVQRRQ